MQGFSTVDGFLEVNESVGEMLKYLANEPSVGLYYVQQHTHNSVPNLLRLNEKVVGKSHESTLHTEDLEDSITMVRSMKNTGPSIIDDMIKDINKSLIIMSTSHPQRGLIRNPSSGLQTSSSNSLGPALRHDAASAHQEGEESSSYFSTVLKSAKQRAAGIRWPQLDPNLSLGVDKLRSRNPLPSEGATVAVSTLPVTEAEELPLSSQIIDEQHGDVIPIVRNSSTTSLTSFSENYEEFKADREAKLEEWLGK